MRDEETLWALLNNRRDRIEKLADSEARAAMLGRKDVDHWKAKKKLLDESDRLLEELEKLYAQGS